MSGDQDLRLGWVGVGRMGRALATRLLEAGYDVGVYNRTRSKCAPLAELGATVVDTPAELADRDIVFTMVAGSADVEEVVSGPQGLLSRPDVAPGLIIDATTISPSAAAEVRAAAQQRGTAMLAAPVSGNPKVVQSGRLTIVTSGPEEAWQRARPILELLGRSVTYVGEGDRARLVKICHNLMLGVVAQCMAEITVLAEKGGVSRADFLEFLNDSVMGSTFTRYKSPGLREPRLPPDVHARPPAQGLPSRLRGRARARGADAAGRRHRADRPGDGRPQRQRGRLRGVDRADRAGLRARAGRRGRRGRRRPQPAGPRAPTVAPPVGGPASRRSDRAREPGQSSSDSGLSSSSRRRAMKRAPSTP